MLTATMADVIDLPVERFEVPLLMAHHGRGRCRETCLRDARRTTGKIRALRTARRTISGGRDEGSPCQAMSYHRFNGIESEVVDAVAQWMLTR